MAQQTHWKNLANYDYLGAYSLSGKDEAILTIKNVKKERVTATGGTTDECIVLYFEDEGKIVDGVLVKPMVCNKTNCKAISVATGSEFIEEWIGKKIKIFATTTKFGRETVACLRVKKEVVIEQTYNCEVCGKIIEKRAYEASQKKYGVGVCSGECLQKYNETKGEQE